ncbi:Uma2 family endonuclease [Nostoc sp. NIES-2111]
MTPQHDEDEDRPMGAITTRAADGIARRAFTVAEVERMQELGIFRPDEKFELVEGEIVPMQAKSPVHELIKETLFLRMARALPPDMWMGVERTIFLGERTFLDPDLSLFAAERKTEKVDGRTLILAIEVSHSTLGYDKGLKAQLYARYGVPEYWVIDVKRRTTIVHRSPRADGTWEQHETWSPSRVLSHPAVPGFAVRLSEI